MHYQGSYHGGQLELTPSGEVLEASELATLRLRELGHLHTNSCQSLVKGYSVVGKGEGISSLVSLACLSVD